MRSLGQPEVLKSALLAALAGAVLCYPRVCTAPHQVYPVWYMETILFLGGTFLWGFVFAWHTKYTGQPVFTLKIGWRPFTIATVCGLAAALAWRFVFDPVVRARVPEDYPNTLNQWLAMTLFSLALTQLFIVFSPFAWLMRMCQKKMPAVVLTVLFGVAVMLVRHRESSSLFTPAMFAGFVALRLAGLLLSVYLLLRGGVLLVWWWVLLFESRHLLGLAG